MADILIRGMEMPKRCSDCWLMDGEDSWCTAMRGKHLDGSYRYGIKDKPDWCPIIALPEGHGRLIDASKLMKHYAWWGENDEQRELFDEIIDQQETIVPAEEEDT